MCKDRSVRAWLLVSVVGVAQALSLARAAAPGAPSNMVLVPAGRFTMGSAVKGDEMPQREVELSAFYIDMYEVTNAEYATFLDWMQKTGDHSKCHPGEADGKDHRPTYWDDKRLNLATHPVVGVDWFDAYAYAAWAGKRLPTEAEWERAARGTDGRRYPWGDDGPKGKEGYRANSKSGGFFSSDGYKLTAPIDAFANGVSPAGCYNMAGNVWEWCADWYQFRYYESAPGRDPKGPADGEKRCARGGSCYVKDAIVLRCANRNKACPRNRFYDFGFRCVKDVAASAAPAKGE